MSGTRRFAGVGRMAAATAGVFVLALVAACSSGVDVDDLEQQVATQVAERLDVDAAAVKVVCPADIPVATGETTTCSARADGVSYDITLTQVDDDGTFEWTLDGDGIAPGDSSGGGPDVPGGEAPGGEAPAGDTPAETQGG